MTQDKPLSITDITQELNSGIATIKFILKRFSPWLPFDRIDGHHYYSRNTIPILIKIKEYLDAGMLPSEIDQELKNSSHETSDTTTEIMEDSYFSEQPNEDIRVSKNGLSLIKSLFDDITIQQNRVAAAHEKRAEAEERKASAIEKRAEAEEKKAMAMNNIAMALQEMNQNRIHNPQTREMAFQTAQGLAADETNQDIVFPELKDTEQQDYSEVFNSPDPPFDLLDTSEIDMDDLSDLIEDDMLLDDLSKLIDPTPQPDNIDDLSTLIDTVSTQDSPKTVPQMDDLSLLIDEISSPETQEQIPAGIDDLSLLIAPDFQQATVDDLSALISETPSLRPDITPEKNLKEYKAAVMKTILQLKTEGLSAEESTKRLNQDGVQTISGKPQWSEKAISQIYKFIDSAR